MAKVLKYVVSLTVMSSLITNNLINNALGAEATFQNVKINKTSLAPGEVLSVSFDLSTTGVVANPKTNPIAALTFSGADDSSEDCEEDCGSSVTTLVNGNISKGSWSSKITLGSIRPSGKYKLMLFIPALKGAKGALYYHPTEITFINPNESKKPAPVAATASFSNIVLDKTSLAPGEVLGVTFDLSTTGVVANPKTNPIASLILNGSGFEAEDCEADCGSSLTTLVSGNISKGSWSSKISLGTALPSGKYKLMLFIPALKGAKGAIYNSPTEITYLNPNESKKPTPVAATASFSSIAFDKSSLTPGEFLTVNFDLTTTGVVANPKTNPIASLTFSGADDSSEDCEEDCGSSITTLVSGNLSKGSWSSKISLSSIRPSGKYKLMLFIPALKGVKGALYYHPTEITFSNPNVPNKPAPVKPTKVAKSSSINCVKGKLTKKVTGINPKCPAGYVKK
jgi:hypothetical protein